MRWLIVFAAGLLAHGIHEFIEAGYIPPLVDPVWDINPILSENLTLGLFLKTILGYNGNPALVEVVAYLIYLALALGIYRRPLTLEKEVAAAVEAKQPMPKGS